MDRINRRSALCSLGAATIALTLPVPVIAKANGLNRKLKFGVIADLHGGFAKDAYSRLDNFLAAMQSKSCDALIQLGDFAFPNEKHQKFADKLNAANDTVIHVIGNHEFDYGCDREDCYKAWGIKSSYYRRDVDGLRFLVLDGNDSGSPSYEKGYHSYVGSEQLGWLKTQLEESDKPIVVLSHQPLAGSWSVDNAEDVQKLLAQYKDKVLICLNGHSHIDSLVRVSGVQYLHINSASYFWVGGKHQTAFYKEPLFCLMTVDPDTGTISFQGKSSEWKSQSPKEMGYFDSKEDPPPVAAVVPRIRDHRIAKLAPADSG